LLPCQGAPETSNITSSLTPFCTGDANLSLDTDYSSYTGINFQWQSSTDGESYSDISGATQSQYSATVNSKIYYRCNITCENQTNGGITASEAIGFGVAPSANDSHLCFGINEAQTLTTISANPNQSSNFTWYSDQACTNIIKSAYNTYYENDFSSSDLKGATIDGNASITDGRLRLTPAENSKNGGFTIPASNNNADAYKISFKIYTSKQAQDGADGLSYSFANDASGTSSDYNAEVGSGSKLKISFATYHTSGGITKGIRLIYGNTSNEPGQSVGTNGVLGWYSGTEWTNKTANAVVDIDATGKLTLIIDEVTIFNNIQLPADFTNSDKSTWKHVFKSRTGGVNMVHAIDDVKIVEADYSVVTNEYTDNFASTTTLYVVEIDAGGCSSQAVAVTAEIETPLTDGLSNNDFIWTGNTNEIWNTEKNNWLQYTASGFQIPANAPVSTNNVVIRKTDNCYTTIPEIETNTISIGSLKIYGNNELILRNNSKIEINGNMDIESNGILTTNGNTTIECTGSWTNNGTFNAGIGTVILKPTSSINLYPKGVTENKQFYNLTIAGSGTVTLQNHIQINNDFKISSSTFVTGSFNMTVGGNWTRETTAANFNVGSNKTQTVTLTGTGKTIGTYSTTFRNLVIEGSYTLNANISTVQYLNERGDLTIASNASLNANDKQISVGGNWTNNGSFNAGTGLVSFNGSGLQTITSGGSPFNKVWFISNVGFNLTDIMTINGDANFYHGIVNYSPSGALVFGENASSNIGNENSYVDGLITKTGSNAFNFATGQGSYWGPISISDAVSSRTISAIYKHETPPYVNWNPGYMCAGSGLHHVSGVEYWLLESSENDNKQPDVTLYWSDNVESGIEPAYIDKLRVAHWGNNNCWENKGGT
ncbi:MAG: hypothetical protein GX879_02755, partial [Bacteroidales bacterium]|nr:hypothetical protein [Bacteroidales bacterium]